MNKKLISLCITSCFVGYTGLAFGLVTDHIYDEKITSGSTYYDINLTLMHNSNRENLTLTGDTILFMQGDSQVTNTKVEDNSYIQTNQFDYNHQLGNPIIQDTIVNGTGRIDMSAGSVSFGKLFIGKDADLEIDNNDSHFTDVSVNSPAPAGDIYIENLTLAGLAEIGASWTGDGEDGDAAPPEKPGPVLVTRIDNLEMQHGSKLTMFPYISGVQFNRLELKNLSGEGDFYLTTSLADGLSDKIYVSEHATGKFGLMVNDSGREVITPRNVQLIYINSGDARFNLLNNGEVVEAGVWQYKLYHETENGHTEWFLAGGKPEELPLPETNKNPDTDINIQTGNNTNPDTDTNIQPGNNTNPDTDTNIQPGNNTNPDTDTNIQPGNNTTPDTDTNIQPGNNTNIPLSPPVVPQPVLSNSAHAVINIATAPRHIIDVETGTLQQRMGDLRRNAGDTGVWARYISDDSRLSDNHYSSFRSNLSGMQIGADHQTESGNGKLLVGAFTSYSKSNIKSENINNGNIRSYSAGIYATWIDNSGFYMDTLLKANHLSNEVRTTMNSGIKAEGDYSLNTITASTEAGYSIKLTDTFRLIPYGKVAYSRMGKADYSLDNGMQAGISEANSVLGEAGTLLESQFCIAERSVRPYAKIAVSREFIRNNRIEINNISFNSNYSGNVGKYGLGVTADVGDRASIYAEVNYQNGNKIETPVNATAGFRISF